ncbi:hypothetical protein SUGI_1180510 [Cryptomeria japonica]|nr:hypothetical protein SUGI_1180510 [Cryptomeria japonica]
MEDERVFSTQKEKEMTEGIEKEMLEALLTRATKNDISEAKVATKTREEQDSQGRFKNSTDDVGLLDGGRSQHCIFFFIQKQDK